MSYGVGCRCGSDPTLLWLCCRPTATAPIWPLAWEPPHAVGAALKKKQKTKKKNDNSDDNGDESLFVLRGKSRDANIPRRLAGSTSFSFSTTLGSSHFHFSVPQTLHILLRAGPLPEHLLPHMDQAISYSSFEIQAQTTSLLLRFPAVFLKSAYYHLKF